MKLAPVIVILVSMVTIWYPVATQYLPSVNPDNLLSGAPHVCQKTKSEPYHRQVSFTQYYTERASRWCMSIPPRCTVYKTASRIVYRREKRNMDQKNYFCCPGDKVTECHNWCVPEN